MATFNKFNSFALALLNKQHNFTSDVFKVMLSNTLPLAANAVKTDITEAAFTAASGYTAGGPTVAIASVAQSGGVATVTGTDVTITNTGSTGATIGPFEYAVLYNSTANLLVGWWDRGSAATLAVGDSCPIDFDPGGANVLLTVA